MINKDKAKEYTEGKVIEALSQVVADAYLAGYNAGYQDGIGKVAKDSCGAWCRQAVFALSRHRTLRKIG